MRALVIDDFAKAAVQRVVDFATLPENWYRPGITSLVPGEDPRFVAHLKDGFRAVFTISKFPDGLVLRHLSISVNSDKLPHIAAAFTIAEMFGFSGWDGKTLHRIPDGWMSSVNKAENCVVLGQPYDEAKVTA